MVYRLKDFGSYTAGGRVLEVTEGTPRMVQFTRTASFEVDPRGHFAVEQAYVQYFLPEDRNAEAPVILVHGGGMSGSCWETTPDGRPGWLHHLLVRGYEVHVMDAVERGRAGFAPDLWEGAPLLRSLEEAWNLFRIGPPQGFATRSAYADQRFPVAAFEAFARSFVPRWLSTTALQTAALLAVLRRTGPATVICHSQGGEITFDAHAQAPTFFERIIALEPSGFPETAEVLGATPLVICAGDYLQTAPHWQSRSSAWHALAASGGTVHLLDSDALGPGHSHMLMMDEGCESILQAALMPVPSGADKDKIWF